MEQIHCISTAAASYYCGIRFKLLMKTKLHDVFSVSSSLLESHYRASEINKTVSSPVRCYLILL
jgi:hypothetical protein